jgi:serine/threonine protein kinase
LPPAPPKISDYELLERIGSGAYGEVWLGRNLATGAQRAIKIVYRVTFSEERPFQREFEGIKKFEVISHSHPSQLAILHVGRNEEGGYFYYVMELADGIENETPDVVSYKPHTLRSALEQGRLPAARVLEIAVALTEALGQLHSHGLIHRDVKPANIIFVGGRPKLADIGLVTDASDSRSIVGTEGYLAPEGPGTPQADLFALGKVLYEALTGLDRRQYPELPADLREWPDAKLVFELNTIVVKLCAADSKERYRNAGEVTDELAHLQSGKSVQRRHWMRSARLTALKVALGVALLLAASTIYRRNQAPARVATTQELDFAHSGTTNFTAWEAFSRAGIISARFSPAGFSNAITYYERALELDPKFTLAWGNLAMATCLSVEKGYIPASEGLPRSLAAAEKALSLDPNNSRALHWKAYCILSMDYDFARAQPLFEKAIEAEPSNWVWRHNYGAILWDYGRFEEAEKRLREALHLSPQQAHPHLVLGYIRASRGKLSEALVEIDDAILLNPTYPMSFLERATLLWTLGRRDEAPRDWRKFLELGGFPMLTSDEPALLAASKASPEDFLRTLLGELEKRRAQGSFVSSFDLACFHALLGAKSRALDYLEAAVDEHRPFTLCAKVHIVFRDLQDEPRYHAALRRLKLE